VISYKIGVRQGLAQGKLWSIQE